MYRINKIFNNNVALVSDERGLEKILIGRGLAFKKRKGDAVADNAIEKVFTADSSDIKEKFIQLTEEIPINHLELATRVVNDAEKDLRYEFDDVTYIGLADHISYAIRRYRKGQSLSNAMLLEIKKFYPNEFAEGLKALDTIFYYEGVRLSEDEAGFIALHFVNGEQNGEMSLTLQATNIIKKIILLVEDCLNIQLDEESLNYIRLVTHLRFFLQRVSSDEARAGHLPEMLSHVEDACPAAARCANVIIDYMQDELQCEVYPEERVYLILHIQMLIK